MKATEKAAIEAYEDAARLCALNSQYNLEWELNNRARKIREKAYDRKPKLKPKRNKKRIKVSKKKLNAYLKVLGLK